MAGAVGKVETEEVEVVHRKKNKRVTMKEMINKSGGGASSPRGLPRRGAELLMEEKT